MSHLNTFVYVIQAGPYTKIGVSKDPHKRLTALKTGCPHSASVISVSPLMTLEDAYSTESKAHKALRHYRTNGEWFKLPSWVLPELTTQLSNSGNKGFEFKFKSLAYGRSMTPEQQFLAINRSKERCEKLMDGLTNKSILSSIEKAMNTEI